MNVSRIRSRRRNALLLAPVLITAAVAGTANGANGDLVQLAGTDGCITVDGTNGQCATGRGLPGLTNMDLSADGTFAYTSSDADSSVGVFQRNPLTGVLAQLPGPEGCFTAGNDDPCTHDARYGNPVYVKLSTDERTLYVARHSAGQVQWFNRNPATGTITFAGCISDGGGGTDNCASSHGMGNPHNLETSADGRFLYVAAFGSNAVVTLRRDEVTGALSQDPGPASCISSGDQACTAGVGLGGSIDVALSPDGGDALVANWYTSAIALLDRDPQTGYLTQKPGTSGCISDVGDGTTCADVRGMSAPLSLAFSPDGTNVYAAAYNDSGVAIFDRDPNTGVLTQQAGHAGCISDSGTNGDCAVGRGMNRDAWIIASRDGESVYASSNDGGSVARFDRDPATGALTQPATGGCLGYPTGCDPIVGFGTATYGMALSPDDATLYVLSPTTMLAGITVFRRSTTYVPPATGGGGGAAPGGNPIGVAGSAECATPPAGPVGVSLNDGAAYTNTPVVEVSVVWPRCAASVLVANDGGFAKAAAKPVAASFPWRLATTGPERLPKTVYLRFGDERTNYSDDIILDQTPPVIRAASARVIRGGTSSAREAARASRTSLRVRLAARDDISGVTRLQVAGTARGSGVTRPFRARSTVGVTPVNGKVAVRVRNGAGSWSKWRTITVAP